MHHLSLSIENEKKNIEVFRRCKFTYLKYNVMHKLFLQFESRCLLWQLIDCCNMVQLCSASILRAFCSTLFWTWGCWSSRGRNWLSCCIHSKIRPRHLLLRASRHLNKVQSMKSAWNLFQIFCYQFFQPVRLGLICNYKAQNIIPGWTKILIIQFS